MLIMVPLMASTKYIKEIEAITFRIEKECKTLAFEQVKLVK